MNARNRNRIAGFALVSSALLSSASAQAATIQSTARPVADRYIVVLADDAAFAPNFGESAGQAFDRGTRELASFYGGSREKSYTAALRGFRFAGSRAAAENLARDAKVALVAEDGLVELSAIQTPAPSWGLDRIDQRPGELDTSYEYHQNGQGVDLYVIDSGIRATHVDFGGRVDTVNAFTAIQDGRGTDDCNGHGTHVAGIAGAATYGVAKEVTLHPVRVVGCDGLGPVSNVIAGIDWLTARHQAAGAPRAVVNISLNNSYSQPLDVAVAGSIAQGIVYVVAAGNHGDDVSCFLSPQRLPEAITVGASTESGARWNSSNYGGCVDLFAPGENILSTFPANDTSTLAMSGTSMAAPHVAGAAALYFAAHPQATPAEVQDAILDAATVDLLSDIPSGENRLLYSAFVGEVEPEPTIFVDGFELGHTGFWSYVVGQDDTLVGP